MPMYEYRCNSCNYHFENIQKFSDSDLLTCPKCNTDNLKKLQSFPEELKKIIYKNGLSDFVQGVF